MYAHIHVYKHVHAQGYAGVHRRRPAHLRAVAAAPPALGGAAGPGGGELPRAQAEGAPITRGVGGLRELPSATSATSPRVEPRPASHVCGNRACFVISAVVRHCTCACVQGGKWAGGVVGGWAARQCARTWVSCASVEALKLCPAIRSAQRCGRPALLLGGRRAWPPLQKAQKLSRRDVGHDS